MKLVLVDDNVHFRNDLKFFLETRLNHYVIGEPANEEEFIAAESLADADIILMNLTMNRMNGLDIAKKMLMNFPHLKVLAITMNTEDIFLHRLKESGFKGFILKTEIFKSLETVLQSVYMDEFVFSDHMN